MKIQNQHQEGSCVFSGVTRFCQKVGCARNRLQFHTVLQKLKSFSRCSFTHGKYSRSHSLDLVIELFHSEPKRTDGPKRELRGNPSAIAKLNMHNSIPIRDTNVIPTNIDHFPSNTKNSHSSAMLYVFEDTEAVIEMIIIGRSPTMRHVSRTHRVALDWFDRINFDPKIQIKNIDTKNQLADILTKGNFTLGPQDSNTLH